MEIVLSIWLIDNFYLLWICILKFAVFLFSLFINEVTDSSFFFTSFFGIYLNWGVIETSLLIGIGGISWQFEV